MNSSTGMHVCAPLTLSVLCDWAGHSSLSRTEILSQYFIICECLPCCTSCRPVVFLCGLYVGYRCIGVALAEDQTNYPLPLNTFSSIIINPVKIIIFVRIPQYFINTCIDIWYYVMFVYIYMCIYIICQKNNEQC